jgi:hypothetical protein
VLSVSQFLSRSSNGARRAEGLDRRPKLGSAALIPLVRVPGVMEELGQTPTLSSHALINLYYWYHRIEARNLSSLKIADPLHVAIEAH